MGKLTHHSYFEKEKNIQSFLFPNVCFECRKVFRKPSRDEARICPECSNTLIVLSRKFKAPKKSNIEEWKVIEFIVKSGFTYHTIHFKNGQQAKYPKTMNEAKEFVIRYRNSAN